jgi:DNA segregation ATPase FtsK/SpoIIIE-like protein
MDPATGESVEAEQTADADDEDVPAGMEADERRVAAGAGDGPAIATNRLRFAVSPDDASIPEALSVDEEALPPAASPRERTEYGARDEERGRNTGRGPAAQTGRRGSADLRFRRRGKRRARVFESISINRDYIIPAAFLQPSSASDAESWKSEIVKNSELLVSTLNDFGIESRVVNVNRGPVITLYEMQIAPGIKVNRIVGLSDDIAMALSGSRVRIVAPIPGKSAIGVEVPNKKREMVNLGDIITAKEYQSHPGSLKVALGKDILGKPVTLDLKKLPHLLIAGATGSGKSVCVNSIITSLIYNYDPNYVRSSWSIPRWLSSSSTTASRTCSRPSSSSRTWRPRRSSGPCTRWSGATAFCRR